MTQFFIQLQEKSAFNGIKKTLLNDLYLKYNRKIMDVSRINVVYSMSVIDIFYVYVIDVSYVYVLSIFYMYACSQYFLCICYRYFICIRSRYFLCVCSRYFLIISFLYICLGYIVFDNKNERLSFMQITIKTEESLCIPKKWLCRYINITIF